MVHLNGTKFYHAEKNGIGAYLLLPEENGAGRLNFYEQCCD
jgi:hypothetical protein